MRLLALALACLCERAVAFSPSRARTPTRSVARPVAYLDSLSAPVVVDAAVVGVDVTAAHFAVRIFSRTSFRGDAGPRRGVAEARHPRRGYSAETGALLRYLNSLAAAPGSIKNARPAINEVLKARIDPVADAKRRLLEACDAFEATQRRAAEEAEAAAAAAAAAAPKKRWYQRRKGNALKAESYASVETQVNDASAAQRDAVISSLEELAKLSPPETPLDGWQGRGGVSPSSCGLDGRWKLRFTNAADARFRSDAETSQIIDADKGLFVNAVDFTGASGKLKGFRVEVDGDALSDTEVQLAFRRVRLLRRSRFPRLLGTITIPLPNPARLRKLTKWLSKGGNEGSRGAGFEILFLDGDTRAHRTFDGLYFVQTRAA